MVINQENSYINSFTKGMNSDSSYDLLLNTQYTFGKNIRITKNQAVGGVNEYSLAHEGIVTPVPSGAQLSILESFINRYKDNGIQHILSVNSVDNMFVVVSRSLDGDNLHSLIVYKGIIEDATGINSDYPMSFTDSLVDFKQIYRFKDFFKGITYEHLFSTALYKEVENVIKLYIATGSHPIISLRIDEEGLSKWNNNNPHPGIDYFMNNRITPVDKVYIDDVISGRLPASQILYTYRFYNKYGNTTQLAPLTNKILVIDFSREREAGNAEGTQTSLGFSLKIPVSNYYKYFDRILIFRLTFLKYKEDSEVSLIYDDDIRQTNGQFVLTDVGIKPLQTLTIEEFSSMSGLILVPLTIETSQNYMFCGNIKDDTIIRDVNVSGSYIRLVFTNVTLAENFDGSIPKIPTSGFKYDECIYPVGLTTSARLVNLYFIEHGINPNIVKNTYNNMFTSSLLRSLRRGEEYRYGIVYYDKFGRHSDVCKIGNCSVSSIAVNNKNTWPFLIIDGNLVARPIGVQITIPQPKDSNGNLIKDIVGCQIVRRSSSDVYQKTLLQVALARPIQQGLSLMNGDYESKKRSPFYPSGFLTTNDITITPPYYIDILDYSAAFTGAAFDKLILKSPLTKYARFQAYTNSNKLFQIFSSEIDYRRDDVLERLNISGTTIEELMRVSPKFKRYGDITDSLNRRNWEEGLNFFGEMSDSWHPYRYNLYETNGDPLEKGKVIEKGLVLHRDMAFRLSEDMKSEVYWTFNYFDVDTSSLTAGSNQDEIISTKDVKIPNWSDGFSNIQRDGNNHIIDAIKKYKMFTTIIDKHTYNNWVSWCKYDLKPGPQMSAPNQPAQADDAGEFIETGEHLNNWLTRYDWHDEAYDCVRDGFIGPGGSNFLIVTKNEDKFGTFTTPLNKLYTSICNIKHSAKTDNIESDEQVLYYGFGNYFPLTLYNGTYKVPNTNATSYLDNVIVFDGDIYITPHEITTMYKAYDFESADTLQSTLITNYIPLESKVNTYFDYGKNLLNTNSSNLIYEPGQIEGVVTQERPAHQYNMIYSDNDASNDVFTLISTDKDETNEFKQRAYFSEPKQNGEFIDNFLIFKAASFIDVDSKYGQITNLLTDKNVLYYWQDTAFGKFSVNERSLINDQNNNTIMLGQAGILSRYDYISTKYGMRLYDFCACPAKQNVYWVDINNRAIVVGNGSQAANYGEQLNVQNVINHYIMPTYPDTSVASAPKVDYDVQNDELLCQCLDDELMVFNIKYNIATSIYTRRYNNIVNINNKLFGLYFRTKNEFRLTKYNYLRYTTKDIEYLKPMILSFIVNPNVSVTKVFDSQQIVPIKREKYLPTNVDKTQLSFETDLYKATKINNKDTYTDREGNIIYNIPRFGDNAYGNRLRGKWMSVMMENNVPTEYCTLSHVITKFRQSFS